MNPRYAVTYAPNPQWIQVVVWWQSSDWFTVSREHAAQLARVLAPLRVWVTLARPHWLPVGGYLTLETGRFTYAGMDSVGGRTPTSMTVAGVKVASPNVPWRAMVQLPNVHAAAHEVFAHLLGVGHRAEPGYVNSGPVTGPTAPAPLVGELIHPDDLAAAMELRRQFLHWYYGWKDWPSMPAGWRFPWRSPLAERNWTSELSPPVPVATSAEDTAEFYVCRSCGESAAA